MELMFKNDFYRDKAFNFKETQDNNHTIYDAFFVLIDGVDKMNLDNLCQLIMDYYSDKNLTFDEAYAITQGQSILDKLICDEATKKVVYMLAQYSIENGVHLGNNTILDGKINTSSWLSHSLFESILCGQLAETIGLDSNKAKILGLLHDIGRKQTHDFSHTIRGYEMLVDLGWENEAIACLTHSFLAGGRCSSNEQAEPGFYVDDEGISHFDPEVKKDDVTLFLEKYQYTDYDLILNIADLMATDKEIVSPLDRIVDIASRRKAFDPTNRGFFLAELTNHLNSFRLQMQGKNLNNLVEIKASRNVSLDDLNKFFAEASTNFFDVYKKFYPSKEEPKKII